MSEKHEFKAEVRQLLDILARSLYTNREIFLRELISNASDALDKLRFQQNRGDELVQDEQELRVELSVDKDAGVLKVTDNGVGMSREELIEDIGTIARSGSAAFLTAAGEEKDKLDGLIGKFGVGFYSVFMVAEEVIVESRSSRPGLEPVRWRSDGAGTYELEPLTSERRRGTTVELRLREDAKEFLEDWRLKEAIKRHSSFISFPIELSGERLNTVPALWREPKFSVKDEQYEEFYKYLTRDDEAPLERLHVSVDAPVQYNALLFVPKEGLDLQALSQGRPGLDLYIRRVLIQHGNTDLVPEYLGFLRGVVDSEDLPLNISRETLQENRNLQKISKNLAKQVLGHLEKLAKSDQARYLELWRAHGKLLKLGYVDFANRDRWASLLRFNTSRCDDAEGLVSLDEYIERAKQGQDAIYYAAAASREALRLNPHLEIFRAKGLEVLYLFDPLDEFALEGLGTYKDFKLRSVEHADAGSLEQFPDETPKDQARAELSDEEKETFSDLTKRMKKLLGERVTEVRVSARLTESPCRLVGADGTITSSMQRILQIVGREQGSIPAKIFEVNQDHPLVRNLLAVYRADPDDPYLRLVVEQLYESALLLEGYLRDPHELVERVQRLLVQSSDWYRKVKDLS